MELRPAGREEITRAREERAAAPGAGITPFFYARLAAEAEPLLIVDTEGPGGVLGHVLLLERAHGSHSHVTVVEMSLGDAHRSRYEDALDLIREERGPTAYLVRTDDCRLSATLLARGLQVEATAVVLVAEGDDEASEGGKADGLGAGPGGDDMVVTRLERGHLKGLRRLLADEASRHRPDDHAGHDHSGPGVDETLAELRLFADRGDCWALLDDGRPVAVIARQDGGDGTHELLDFVVAQAAEPRLARALREATRVVRREGRLPAAVIDANESARRRIFRAAGYYTAAAYMVFYDPEAGRPSVGTVGVDEVRALVEGEEAFRLVDVLGEAHWRDGHLPRSEWIDFRGLARESRRRFTSEEPIILYCNGFT